VIHSLILTFCNATDEEPFLEMFDRCGMNLFLCLIIASVFLPLCTFKVISLFSAKENMLFHENVLTEAFTLPKSQLRQVFLVLCLCVACVGLSRPVLVTVFVCCLCRLF
jgi:hypothetical protein